MQPKSLPLTISCVLFMLIGTGLLALGIGLPTWTESTHSRGNNQELGLFEQCQDGSCEERDSKSDELKTVTGLCIISCGVALLTALTAMLLLCLSLRKRVNNFMNFLPWMTVTCSLISGGSALAGLIIFQDKEYDEDDTYIRLGISFVLVGTGAGLIVISGIAFMFGAKRLLTYLEGYGEKELL